MSVYMHFIWKKYQTWRIFFESGPRIFSPGFKEVSIITELNSFLLIYTKNERKNDNKTIVPGGSFKNS